MCIRDRYKTKAQEMEMRIGLDKQELERLQDAVKSSKVKLGNLESLMKQNERNEQDMARKVDELCDEKKNLERQEAAMKEKLETQKAEIESLQKQAKELKETEVEYAKRDKEYIEKEKLEKKKEAKKTSKKPVKKGICGC
eukprot:TRINITY_DN2388_c0_g1_i4.p3 TRINITY_DN2388_c0_g1~~TRINITY_DN2388_c0_g1_i4.p3  ORF type:complete len:140 (-),score=66.55 TRINITY_DN2388_c0_g1_i4:106-525(-)